MSFVDSTELEQLKAKITDDPSSLGKLYQAKKNDYYIRNVDHNLVEGMIKEGWEKLANLRLKLSSGSLKVIVQNLKMIFGVNYMT